MQSIDQYKYLVQVSDVAAAKLTFPHIEKLKWLMHGDVLVDSTKYVLSSFFVFNYVYDQVIRNLNLHFDQSVSFVRQNLEDRFKS